jgi:hypothetical protein
LNNNQSKESIEQVNPQALIQNLYTLYGKKCVENDAFRTLLNSANKEKETLVQEIRELKERLEGKLNGNIRSN